MMLSCKHCRYYNTFNRLIIYCDKCICLLNDKAERESYNIKRGRKNKGIEYVLDMPIFQEEFNNLIDLINSSKKSYKKEYNDIYKRIISLGMIYVAFGEENEYYIKQYPVLEKDLSFLYCKIMMDNLS